MDPDTALANARAALAAHRANEDNDVDALVELADAFEALDGWLTNRGYLPSAWAAGRGFR